jgi:hypothetical protein
MLHVCINDQQPQVLGPQMPGQDDFQGLMHMC